MRILLSQNYSKIQLNFILPHDRNTEWAGFLTKTQSVIKVQTPLHSLTVLVWHLVLTLCCGLEGTSSLSNCKVEPVMSSVAGGKALTMIGLTFSVPMEQGPSYQSRLCNSIYVQDKKLKTVQKCAKKVCKSKSKYIKVGTCM